MRGLGGALQLAAGVANAGRERDGEIGAAGRERQRERLDEVEELVFAQHHARDGTGGDHCRAALLVPEQRRLAKVVAGDKATGLDEVFEVGIESDNLGGALNHEVELFARVALVEDRHTIREFLRGYTHGNKKKQQ